MGTASQFMFWARLCLVNTGVLSSILPHSLAASTEYMSLMRACCCSILSPFAKLGLQKKTLNSLVQIWNSTGVLSFVSLSGF